jgi:hypothetical protein
MIGQIRNGKLIIAVKVQEPKLSLSGKTLVVASTRGPRKSSLTINGKPVYVIANAYIQPDALPAQATKSKKKSASKESRLRTSTKGAA